MIPQLPKFTLLWLVSFVGYSLSQSITQGFCSAFDSVVPSQCRCIDASKGLTISCAFTVPHTNFNFGAQATLALCANPLYAAAYYNSSAAPAPQLIDKVVWGQSTRVPIPGLAVTVPGLGSLAMELEADVSGPASNADITLAIGGCVDVLNQKKCDSNLPVIGSLLPFRILDANKLDFAAVLADKCAYRLVPPPPPPSVQPYPIGHVASVGTIVGALIGTSFGVGLLVSAGYIAYKRREQLFGRGSNDQVQLNGNR